jgi:8-oxo-dGTP pyrophosphatase MutT (NUDIX family)
MKFGPPAESEFSADRFFARAAERLASAPPEAVGDVLGDHVLNPDLGALGPAYRDAAVLIPVVARDPSVTVLLTVRTAHLTAHAGQIAFPGGKIDPTDATPAAAAIREAEEEVGLKPSGIQTVGYLPPYLSRTGYRIFPVVGRVDPDHSLTINPEEVVEAFEVPLEFLMSPGNHRMGRGLFQGKQRAFYEMPYERRYIWGVTAGIIRGLYERMFD